MDILKEPERITLVEGLELLERHFPTEEAKSRLRQAFIRKAFRQAPGFAFSYDEADIDWVTGSVKIPRKRDRFCPSFSRSEFNAYFFEEGLAGERGGERLMASGTRTMLAKPRAEVEQKIKERIHLGIQMRDQPKRNFAEAAKFAEDVQKWRNFNLDLLENCFSDRSKRDEYYRSARESYVDASESVIEGIGITGVLVSVQKQIQTLESIFDRLEFYEPTSSTPVSSKNLSKVFVVHGHDEGAPEGVARFLEKIGLTAIILREQPNQGRTTIEKFVDYAGAVGFAVVLLTPDDLGGAAATEVQLSRARQNVIFELGYFVGSLGRGRACLLRKGEVEIPSDLYGVVYTAMDSADSWKIELARELKAAGFEFDAAKGLV
jgi:predicted nucleotide-binding protein